MYLPHMQVEGDGVCNVNQKKTAESQASCISLFDLPLYILICIISCIMVIIMISMILDITAHTQMHANFEGQLLYCDACVTWMYM